MVKTDTVSTLVIQWQSSERLPVTYYADPSLLEISDLRGVKRLFVKNATLTTVGDGRAELKVTPPLASGRYGIDIVFPDAYVPLRCSHPGRADKYVIQVDFDSDGTVLASPATRTEVYMGVI